MRPTVIKSGTPFVKIEECQGYVKAICGAVIKLQIMYLTHYVVVYKNNLIPKHPFGPTEEEDDDDDDREGFGKFRQIENLMQLTKIEIENLMNIVFEIYVCTLYPNIGPSVVDGQQQQRKQVVKKAICSRHLDWKFDLKIHYAGLYVSKTKMNEDMLTSSIDGQGVTKEKKDKKDKHRKFVMFKCDGDDAVSININDSFSLNKYNEDFYLPDVVNKQELIKSYLAIPQCRPGGEPPYATISFSLNMYCQACQNHNNNAIQESCSIVSDVQDSQDCIVRNVSYTEE
ncbi:hypothetical protein H4219_004827 [Mycoemilia scoparia]|uniref:Uncharacterized protein n=1 Tax=Mycoemilia scoparia TaxID=417184 RepID=A0A9W7ZQA7_9FUNG|nr:hypothetical protein H4219_004827 [Mycoemilia scoparia]